MAGRGDRDDARRDFALRLEAAHVLCNIAEDAPRVEQIEPLGVGSAGEIGVVHPVFPFAGGRRDLGIGKNRRVVLGLDAVDVVGMEMRDQHDVDRLRIDAGRFQVRLEHLRGMCDLPAGAGVDEDALCSGIDQKRGERDRQCAAGGDERFGQSLFHFGERKIADKVRLHRPVPDAVVDGGERVAAEPKAVEARRLLCGIAEARICAVRQQRGGGGRRCRASQDAPPRQVVHAGPRGALL